GVGVNPQISMAGPPPGPAPSTMSAGFLPFAFDATERPPRNDDCPPIPSGKAMNCVTIEPAGGLFKAKKPPNRKLPLMTVTTGVSLAPLAIIRSGVPSPLTSPKAIDGAVNDDSGSMKFGATTNGLVCKAVPERKPPSDRPWLACKRIEYWFTPVCTTRPWNEIPSNDSIWRNEIVLVV